MKGLGYVQRNILPVLASREAGCTSADFAGLTSSQSALQSLNALAGRGLAKRAGLRMRAAADGRGQPPRVFVITDAGRQMAGRAS